VIEYIKVALQKLRYGDNALDAMYFVQDSKKTDML